MSDEWLDDVGTAEGVPPPLARVIEATGRRVLEAWASRCSWCRGRLTCPGDPYFCAAVGVEWERESVAGR